MIELESMSVAMPEVAGHPNRRAFRGVLTTVDVASQRSPSGARGHLVLLTKQAAEGALPSLLGMALDYSPALDRHDAQRKVGVITRAEIRGRNLELGGYLFAKDFPEIVKEIEKSTTHRERKPFFLSEPHSTVVRTIHADSPRKKTSGWPEVHGFRTSVGSAAERIFRLTETLRRCSRLSLEPMRGLCRTIRAETSMKMAGESGLGLSYEVTNVEVVDPKKEIWMLAKVTFTGAAILKREKAAYKNTWIELCT